MEEEWKNKSTSWERLADLKESYPIQVAEYAVAKGIDKEPAFAWWVPYVLRRRDRIIAAVNKRYHKRSHKFGIEIPKTVKRALEIDEEMSQKTGKPCTLWRDAIAKEMTNVRIAFKILEDGKDVPIRYNYMDCHMVFDIKLDGFKRKACLVAGGHVLDLVAVLVVGELDRPYNCRPVVACRGDHRGGGAVGQAQDHAVVTLHQHKSHKIQVTHHYL